MKINLKEATLAELAQELRTFLSRNKKKDGRHKFDYWRAFLKLRYFLALILEFIDRLEEGQARVSRFPFED